MDTTCNMQITDEQRKKIFGYAKAAWEAAGAPGRFDDWRHEQQQACGVSSLKYCVKEQYFTLVQHYTGIIRAIEEAKREGRSANANSRRVLIIDGCKNKAQIGKINALLVDQSLAWEYADAMALRMFKVKRVEHCDARQLRAVIAALVKNQQRHGGRHEPAKQPRKEQ